MKKCMYGCRTVITLLRNVYKNHVGINNNS